MGFPRTVGSAPVREPRVLMPLQSERDSLGHFLAWKSMAAGGVAALRLRHRVVLRPQIGADHRRLDRLSPQLRLRPSGPRRGVDLRCLTDPDVPIDANHLELGARHPEGPQGLALHPRLPYLGDRQRKLPFQAHQSGINQREKDSQTALQLSHAQAHPTGSESDAQPGAGLSADQHQATGRQRVSSAVAAGFKAFKQQTGERELACTRWF